MSKQEMTYVQHLHNISTELYDGRIINETGLCDHKKEGKQLRPRRRCMSRCLKNIKCLGMCVVGLLCCPNGCYLNDYGTICCLGPGAPPALYDKFHNDTSCAIIYSDHSAVACLQAQDRHRCINQHRISTFFTTMHSSEHRHHALHGQYSEYSEIR